MPPERRSGPSYMRGGVVACPKRRHASPRCAPPHGRSRRGSAQGGTPLARETRGGGGVGFGKKNQIEKEVGNETE